MAMDKIIKISQSDKMTPPIPGDNPPVNAQPTPGQAGGTRNKSNQSDGEEKSLLDRVKEARDSVLSRPSTVNIVASSTVHSKFAIGDHVVLQPVDSAPIRGIVRWAGPVRTTKDTGGIVIPVVGVETVSTNY